jgi:hypothetical protein
MEEKSGEMRRGVKEIDLMLRTEAFPAPMTPFILCLSGDRKAEVNFKETGRKLSKPQ